MTKLDQVVDRVKPWLMVHGHVHGHVHGLVHGLTHGLIHGLIHGLVNCLVHGLWYIVSFIMFFLNMVDYPAFFPPMSTLTWDTIVTLSGS